MHRFLFLALALGVNTIASADGFSRTWTDTNGKTEEAAYVRAVGGKVTLRLANGAFKYPGFYSLSKPDQEYVRARIKKKTHKDAQAIVDRLTAVAEESKVAEAREVEKTKRVRPIHPELDLKWFLARVERLDEVRRKRNELALHEVVKEIQAEVKALKGHRIQWRMTVTKISTGLVLLKRDWYRRVAINGRVRTRHYLRLSLPVAYPNLGKEFKFGEGSMLSGVLYPHAGQHDKLHLSLDISDQVSRDEALGLEAGDEYVLNMHIDDAILCGDGGSYFIRMFVSDVDVIRRLAELKVEAAATVATGR